MPPTALVTGARGFIGRYLVRRLSESGHQVVGWSRQPPDATSGDLPDAVTWGAVDIVDMAAVAAAIQAQPPAVVYHCAGFANPSAAGDDAVGALKGNAISTLNLLEALRLHAPDARLLIPSSGYVYPVSARALDETVPCAPANAYGHSKLAQEVVAQHYAATYPRLHITIARTFNGFGPGQGDDYVIGAFASKIAALERSGATSIQTGNLDHVRDFLDVRDVVEAYITLVERGVSGEAYNVCSGEATEVGLVLEMLRGLATRPFDVVPTAKPDRRSSDRRVLLGDASKLKALGWERRHLLRASLNDTLHSWRSSL